jgi:hypothetical protein
MHTTVTIGANMTSTTNTAQGRLNRLLRNFDSQTTAASSRQGASQIHSDQRSHSMGAGIPSRQARSTELSRPLYRIPLLTVVPTRVIPHSSLTLTKRMSPHARSATGKQALRYQTPVIPLNIDGTSVHQRCLLRSTPGYPRVQRVLPGRLAIRGSHHHRRAALGKQIPQSPCPQTSARQAMPRRLFRL